MLANLFRRSTAGTIGIIVAVFAGVCLVVLASRALIALHGAPAGLARDLLVIVGAFVVLGFILIPIVVGADDGMDPRAFSLFGIGSRPLARDLLTAALISIPALVLAVLSLFTIATWARGPLPVIFAIVCAALAVATCVIASRLAATVAGFFLASRRSRELTGIVGVVLVVLVAPTLILFTSVDVTTGGLAALGGAAEALSWTPFGAVWSAPGDAALGQGGVAVLKLLIALATIALLWFAWDRLVARMLVTPDRDQVVRSHGRGWFDVLPSTQAGVVAARSLTYWARDSRYLVSIIIIPLAPLPMVAALAIAGVPLQPLALLPLPVMALFLGWSLHNDLALDSSAIWMHVSAGINGVSDRLGRTAPVLLIGVPLLVLGATITGFFYGDWVVLPSLFGVSGCLLLAGIGLSSYTSARFPYPAVQPGDSPFQQPQASGGVSARVQGISFVGLIVIAVPSLIFAWLGLTQDPSWHTASLVAGLGLGAIVFVLGIWTGGRVIERRGPEIMAFATSY